MEHFNHLNLILKNHGFSPDEWGIINMLPSSLWIACHAVNRIPEGAQSILVCVFPLDNRYINEPGVASFKKGEDYHKIAKNRAKPLMHELATRLGGAWEFFCDSSPLPEVSVAEEAGIGVRGKNNLLVHPRLGTFLHIFTLVTDVQLPEIKHDLRFNPCKTCDCCLTACPTRNLPNFKRENCVSYITQKKKTPAFGWTWGCDVCQNACPENERAEE